MSPDDGALRIYKLHGSVNWGAPKTVDDKIQIHGDYDAVGEAGERALLIPPTWRKVLAGHVTDVWNKALESLNTATRIVIIGFSMPPTDTHFKYLLAAGLQRNISLRKLFFVNPGLRIESERNNLRANLFSILREELEDRDIIQLIEASTAEFLLRGSNLRTLRRKMSPMYLRIFLDGLNYGPSV